MSLKRKLLTTISMFCLTIALFIVGIWAVSSANIEIDGTISFTATDVYARVSGTITGAETNPTLTTLEYSSNTEPTTTALNSWKNDLVFTEEGTAITITVTIQNLSSDRSLFVTVTDTVGTIENITKTMKQGSATYISGTEYELAKSSSVTYTLSLAVTNTDASASATYGYTVNLRDPSYVQPVDVSDVSFLTFSYDNSAMTASVTDCDTTVTTVDIPSRIQNGDNVYDVISIGYGAFRDCSSLTSVIIPSSVTSIGNYVFYNCTALSSIAIPKRVTSIGSWAFYKCSSLTGLAIPEGVTIIGEYAFSGCSELTSMTIPNSVINIYDMAFSGCSALEYNIYETGKYLGNETNPYIVLCDTESTTMTSFTIHNDCKFIYDSAMSGCSSLTSIVIPNGVLRIADGAFSSCSGLTGTLTIPDSVTFIGASTFNKCTGLTGVIIGTGLTGIDIGAFASCSKLKTVTVKAINPPTFYGINSVSLASMNESLTLLISTPKASVGSVQAIFESCSALTNIYVPSESVSAYQSAGGWSTYSNKISAIV